MKPEHIRVITPDLREELVHSLKELIPSAFCEGKLDIDALKQLLGEEGLAGPERYRLTWAGKQHAIEAFQRPTRFTLVPAPEESIDWETTHNIFIEGENLETLKLLLRPYYGRVKMIYIDPPYNTGNDFIYPDNYTDPLDTYLKVTGQKDEDGNLLTSNPETSGRYHSTWLSMMYPRLLLAQRLLIKDGVLFISIDDHEVHNLRMLMNEVFGEESFKNCVIFRRGIKSVQAQFETIDSLTIGHEYVLMYAKSPETRFKIFRVSLDEPREGSWNNHWRGTDRPTMRYELFDIVPSTGQWRWGKERSLKAAANYQKMLEELGIKEGEEPSQQQIDEWYSKECEKNGEEIDLLRLSRTGKPEHYVPPTDSKVGNDLWADISPSGSAELRALLGGKYLDNPKPVELIRRMVDFITEPDGGDIILDFFAGSCTTAQAVLELNKDDGGNRCFIMVQLPEPTPEDSEARKAGYKTIAEIGKDRIRRVIERLRQQADGQLKDLGFRVFKMAESHFREWEEPEEEVFIEQLKLFVDRLRDGWTLEGVMAEVALKEAGFGLNYRIEQVLEEPNVVYRIVDPDRDQWFYLSLDASFDLDSAFKLDLDSETLLVVRDVALNDATAANLAPLCRLRTL